MLLKYLLFDLIHDSVVNLDKQQRIDTLIFIKILGMFYNNPTIFN